MITTTPPSALPEYKFFISSPKPQKMGLEMIFLLSLISKHSCSHCSQPCVGPRVFSLSLVSSAWVLGTLYAGLPATQLWGRYKVMENGMRSVMFRGNDIVYITDSGWRIYILTPFAKLTLQF